ncbi:MAG: hypothetical protein NTY42_09315 [Planctomycetota bacterium]|nr:hypothetical protein [Planctomycetota bacterium]
MKDTNSVANGEKYAYIWIKNLARFHKVMDRDPWEYHCDHVIVLPRSMLANGLPTWQRLKFVDGLFWHRVSCSKKY